ncbi:hypothetical protein J8F10_19120 [Gemmata sp. G18]|uniref:DUF6194 domain-containing protein n=1 Tax=Gemmata palustris TaxID=2822762 RepID=A0ABS5BUF5_9BACT|nr:DUF6194 family protein [Gemmata palustris]MBP3957362.1 hypothetical protein [Gemmata palustris]
MDEAAITRHITETYPGVDTVVALGATFFFYNPEDGAPKDHMFPFATLVTGDEHDQFSNLNRPGVFRLNVGASKQTFQSLFQTNDHDFTALDTIMPHPVYGMMYWVCVLNPSAETFERVEPLLAEAYQTAVGKRAKREGQP